MTVVRELISCRLVLPLACAALTAVAIRAADESAESHAFDPKRPPAAELEMSVADGFTLAVVGDCIISRPLSQKRVSDPAFDTVVKVLLGADATFGNLETSILDVRSFAGYPNAGADDWGLTSVPAVANDLAALLNADGFAEERTFQTVIAVSRFEVGRVAEIRLYPVDLGYGRRLPDSGVPRLASRDQGRAILTRMREISAAYGTRISLRKNVGIIRPESP